MEIKSMKTKENFTTKPEKLSKKVVLKSILNKDNLKYALKQDLIEEFAKYEASTDLNKEPVSKEQQAENIRTLFMYGSAMVLAGTADIVYSAVNYTAGVGHLGCFECPLGLIYASAGTCVAFGLVLASKTLTKLHDRSPKFKQMQIDFIDNKKSKLNSKIGKFDAKIEELDGKKQVIQEELEKL